MWKYFLLVVFVVTYYANAENGTLCADENDLNQMKAYRGNLSHAEDGTPCLPWNTWGFAYTNPAVTHNYCRLPEDEPFTEEIKVWCYVKETNDDRSWFKYCKPPSCIEAYPEQKKNKEAAECYYHGSPLSARMYVGTTKVTEKGEECIHWNIRRPNDSPRLTSAMPTVVHNYCRVPPTSNDKKPWCYISKTMESPFWQYCNIRDCNDGPRCANISDVASMMAYRGDVSYTEHGKKCVRWDTPNLSYASPEITHNYCRFPESAKAVRSRIWCYTEKKEDGPNPSFGYCNVAACGDFEPVELEGLTATQKSKVKLDGLKSDEFSTFSPKTLTAKIEIWMDRILLKLKKLYDIDSITITRIAGKPKFYTSTLKIWAKVGEKWEKCVMNGVIKHDNTTFYCSYKTKELRLDYVCRDVKIEENLNLKEAREAIGQIEINGKPSTSDGSVVPDDADKDIPDIPVLNREKHCAFWAEQGSCVSNENYMSKNCHEECKPYLAKKDQDQGQGAAYTKDDDFTNDCKARAEKGECVSNKGDMLPQCARECELADKLEKHCEKWAEQGECDLNKNYMMKKCRKQCEAVKKVVEK